ncbi:MAG: hypothetical protein CMH77_06195 [Nitrospinae bacterium]|nr:hypothetical protein [Nitrospinota bacterium]
MVGEHHEQFNGEGYPLNLSGERISLSGRLCTVMDFFSALTSKRCNREPHTLRSIDHHENANARSLRRTHLRKLHKNHRRPQSRGLILFSTSKLLKAGGLAGSLSIGDLLSRK